MGNHNSGRRPKPTALHILRGNPSKKRFNPAEPKPSTGPAVKPKALSEAAEAVWDRVAPVWEAQGTLTASDVEAFATYCEMQAALDGVRAQKNDPDYRVIGSDGEASPAVRLEMRLAPLIRPYYGMFGGDPSSRTKIAVPKQEKPKESKWAGALK